MTKNIAFMIQAKKITFFIIKYNVQWTLYIFYWIKVFLKLPFAISLSVYIYIYILLGNNNCQVSRGFVFTLCD